MTRRWALSRDITVYSFPAKFSGKMTSHGLRSLNLYTNPAFLLDLAVKLTRDGPLPVICHTPWTQADLTGKVNGSVSQWGGEE